MPGPIDPSNQFVAVTASDTAVLSYDGVSRAKCRGIYIGTAGNLAVKNDDGDSITFTGLAAGVVHAISTDVVMSTGTTASNIVALF